MLNGPVTVGKEKPGSGVPCTPIAARLNCSLVTDALPTRLGSRALRATPRSPRACFSRDDESTAPRLNASPRSIASRNDKVPENGRPRVLLTDPRNAPCTSTMGLSVFTPVVGPGTAFSVDTTEPGDVPRPESGTCCGGGPAGAGADNCALAIGAKPRISIRLAHKWRALVI